MGRVWNPNSGSWDGSVDIESQLLVGVAPPNSHRVLRSAVPTTGADFLTIAKTAYFVYVGKKAIESVCYRLAAYLNVLAVGASTAEAGVFSTPLPPNAQGQILTKITATAIWDTMLVGLGMKRSGTFAPLTPTHAGTHLWIGARFDFATTMPTLAGLLYDLQEGEILVEANAAVFSGVGPWTGTLVAAQTGALKVPCAPDLLGRTT